MTNADKTDQPIVPVRTHFPVQDPRRNLGWMATAEADKERLVEAAMWLENPISLSRFDGSADIGRHPDNRTMLEVHSEFLSRAYSAIGVSVAPEKADKQFADDRKAPVTSDAYALGAKAWALMAAAREEAKARLSADASQQRGA